MGLDKFIGGKKVKKRSNEKVKNSLPVNRSSKEFKDDISTITLANSNEISNPLPKVKLRENPGSEYSYNIDNNKLRILISEKLKELTKESIIDILLTQIKSSPTYAANKTMIVDLLKSYNLEEIASLLEIPYYEVLILVTEIKSEQN